MGLAMSLPKKESAMEPGNYRPITLINTQYKFLVRILENHMRQHLTTVTHSGHYCRLPGTTTFDATAVIVTI
jgi:hypothetical protein